MAERSAPRVDLAERLAVYLVADPEQTERDLVEDVIAALDNGVTCVQLRAKHLEGYKAWTLAIQLRQECHSRDVLFIVNDRVDVALAAQADGVHLGVHYLPLAMARWMAGPEFILGYSPQSIRQAADAARQGAHYVGIGPVFATGSKADAGPAIGVARLTEQIEAAELPAVGIGGITAENAGEVIRAGADGVAVISAILRAPDPAEAAARLAEAVRAAKNERARRSD